MDIKVVLAGLLVIVVIGGVLYKCVSGDSDD